MEFVFFSVGYSINWTQDYLIRDLFHCHLCTTKPPAPRASVTRAVRQLLLRACKACYLNRVIRRYTNAVDCLTMAVTFLEDLVNSVIDRR
jgi:hypothetical protein